MVNVEKLEQTIRNRHLRPALNQEDVPILTTVFNAPNLSYVHISNFLEVLDEQGKTINEDTLAITEKVVEPQPPVTPPTPSTAPVVGEQFEKTCGHEGPNGLICNDIKLHEGGIHIFADEKGELTGWDSEGNIVEVEPAKPPADFEPVRTYSVAELEKISYNDLREISKAYDDVLGNMTTVKLKAALVGKPHVDFKEGAGTSE